MEKCGMKLSWVVTVWPKGQIVIPKDIREALWTQAWDSFAVILKDNKYIWLVRNQDMQELASYMKTESK